MSRKRSQWNDKPRTRKGNIVTTRGKLHHFKAEFQARDMLFFLTDKSGPILNCFENHQHRGSDTEGDFDWEIRIEILKSGSSYFQSNTNSQNKFRDGICNLKPRRGRIMDLFGNYFNSEVHN